MASGQRFYFRFSLTIEPAIGNSETNRRQKTIRRQCFRETREFQWGLTAIMTKACH